MKVAFVSNVLANSGDGSSEHDLVLLDYLRKEGIQVEYICVNQKPAGRTAAYFIATALQRCEGDLHG